MLIRANTCITTATAGKTKLYATSLVSQRLREQMPHGHTLSLCRLPMAITSFHGLSLTMQRMPPRWMATIVSTEPTAKTWHLEHGLTMATIIPAGTSHSPSARWPLPSSPTTLPPTRSSLQTSRRALLSTTPRVLPRQPNPRAAARRMRAVMQASTCPMM